MRVAKFTTPSPEHQSIFGDTYEGVPNIYRAYMSVYPNRFHGPNYRYVNFNAPFIQQPQTMPLRNSPLTPLAPLGDAAPIFSSPTGSVLFDAAIGAGVGFIAGKGSKTQWAIAGGIAGALAGTLGILLIAGAGLYNQKG